MVETAGEPEELPPVDSWISKVDFRSTAEVKIPERLVDQVIGQEHAVEVIRKASEQKRHVMLIGDPGTGKSMLARSMTEMLPREDLQDIIVYHNPEDPNEPKIRVVPAGKGREIVNAQKAEAMQRREQKASMVMPIVFFIIGLSCILSYNCAAPTRSTSCAWRVSRACTPRCRRRSSRSSGRANGPLAPWLKRRRSRATSSSSPRGTWTRSKGCIRRSGLESAGTATRST